MLGNERCAALKKSLKERARDLLDKLDDGADAASDADAIKWIIEAFKAVLEDAQ